MGDWKGKRGMVRPLVGGRPLSLDVPGPVDPTPLATEFLWERGPERAVERGGAVAPAAAAAACAAVNANLASCASLGAAGRLVSRGRRVGLSH